MQKHFYLGFIVGLFVIFSAPLSAANIPNPKQQVASLAKIRQLLNAHKANEAYTLASQMAPTQEGNIDFDLLYSAAAMAAQHPDVAIFSLERITMQQPNNLYAKESLGKAYYLTGDYISAKSVLMNLPTNPAAPETIRTDARNLLAQMNNPPKNAAAKPTHAYSVEVLGGYDTNINGATSLDTIPLPNPYVFIHLTGDSLAIRDACTDIIGDWQGTYPLPYTRNEMGLFWDVNGAYRENIHNSAFNLNTFNFIGGGTFQHGPYTLHFPLRSQVMYLNGNSLRRAVTTGANLSRPLINDKNAGLLFIEKGTQIYPTLSQLSARTDLAGAGWLFLPSDNTQTITRVYYGTNKGKLETASAKALSNHYYGAQFSVAKKITDKSTTTIDLGEQFATFNATDPTFGVLRKDNFLNIGLKYEWQYSNNITFISHYNHFQNNSRLPIYHYTRNVAEIGLKYGA